MVNLKLKETTHFPLMTFICGNCILVLFAIFTIFLLKMKKLLIPILALLVITVPIAVADEDEYEEEEDRTGFGLMEREREREHQDDEEIAIGSDVGNMILYGTIGAIVASVGYTGFKIYRAKRPAVSKA